MTMVLHIAADDAAAEGGVHSVVLSLAQNAHFPLSSIMAASTQNPRALRSLRVVLSTRLQPVRRRGCISDISQKPLDHDGADGCCNTSRRSSIPGDARPLNLSIASRRGKLSAGNGTRFAEAHAGFRMPSLAR
jgi:hypothetical protein